MGESKSPIRFVCWTLFFFVLTRFSLAQETKTSPQDPEQSCRSFVQRFYDWYVPKTLGEIESKRPASDLALKYKSSAFSPELARALKEDSEAQANVVGEIVGIDFDPFLFSQDPCERYVVGNITHKEGSYEAEVYGICSGKKHAKPDIVPELMLKNGRWFFVNFHYGKNKQSQDEVLLGILKRLREDRQKHLK